MERVGIDLDGGEVGIRYDQALGIVALSISARTFKPLRVLVLAMRLTITSWLISGATPVHGDEGEQPVLDLVPLAGARREVADRECPGPSRRPAAQFELPQPHAIAVAAAAVGGDHQLAWPWDSAGGPSLNHQRRIVCTANADVSWSMPTLTQPSSAPMS